MGLHKLYGQLPQADVVDLVTDLAGKSSTSHVHGVVPFSPVTYTDGATITLDASLGTFFRGVLAGNRTLANPTGGTDGQRVLVECLAQTSTRTLTITPTIGVTGVTSPISIAAGKRWFGGLLLSSGTWYLIGSAVQP